MRYGFVAIGLLAVAIGIVACEKEEVAVAVAPEEDAAGRVMSAGDYHTEFLEDLTARCDLKTTGKAGLIDACIDSYDHMAELYDLPPLTDGEVASAVADGMHMALEWDENFMDTVLTGYELKWWNRFSSQATAVSARSIYDLHCERHGSPEPDSPLDIVTSIAVSSAEFWSAYRPDAGDDENDDTGERKGWLKVLRAVVNVGVDAAAGGLAAAGTSYTGPVAGAIGGVVGGLASAGADDLIFGD